MLNRWTAEAEKPAFQWAGSSAATIWLVLSVALYLSLPRRLSDGGNLLIAVGQALVVILTAISWRFASRRFFGAIWASVLAALVQAGTYAGASYLSDTSTLRSLGGSLALLAAGLIGLPMVPLARRVIQTRSGIQRPMS